jgi:catechol 2,3-dioxygenase-like lactoylglutathione lyase family enzyme
MNAGRTESLQASPPTSPVRRFDHVGITVADLESATAFFVGLGLELEGPPMGVEGEFLDADVITQRATTLGGTVLMAPFYTPGFRNAVLADPQGGVIAISATIPEDPKPTTPESRSVP